MGACCLTPFFSLEGSLALGVCPLLDSLGTCPAPQVLVYLPRAGWPLVEVRSARPGACS